VCDDKKTAVVPVCGVFGQPVPVTDFIHAGVFQGATLYECKVGPRQQYDVRGCGTNGINNISDRHMDPVTASDGRSCRKEEGVRQPG
jgi:hypothetical protein